MKIKRIIELPEGSLAKLKRGEHVSIKPITAGKGEIIEFRFAGEDANEILYFGYPFEVAEDTTITNVFSPRRA